MSTGNVIMYVGECIARATASRNAGALHEEAARVLPKNILVPTDFSECATRALDYACELAQKLDATVHLVHSFGPGSPEMNLVLTSVMIDTMRSGAAQALESLAAGRSNVRFGNLDVVRGDPRDNILEVAQTLRADLIVIGTHGRRGFARVVLGSVAEHVLRRADCPVITLRGAES
jgi:nucleotide-binding universal stress UspA family protein